MRPNLDFYQSYMAEYYMHVALGQWMQAEQAIRHAISVCPVMEALGYLSEKRTEADRQVRLTRVSWLFRRTKQTPVLSVVGGEE